MELTLSKEDRTLLESLQGGRHARATAEGRVFRGVSAAAGSVLPIFSNTAQVFGIWNPAGNNKVAKLIRANLTYVSTTGAAGGFVLALVKNAPASIGTGAAISAFTDGVMGTSLFNGIFGDGRAPSCRFTPSAATVVAPIIGEHLGLNQLVPTATDATNTQWRASVDFDGDVQLAPGNALFIAGNIATLIIMAPSLVWEERAA